MPTPQFLHKAVGSWKGESKLHLSWLPEDKRVSASESKLHIDFDMKKMFATLTYTWVFEGKVEEGSMLICGSEKSKLMSVGWSDSWHQNSAVMLLKSAEFSHEVIKVTGSYPAGDGTPDWGWRIELSLPSEDQFVLKMFNITPAGEAEWAVEGIYKRD